MYDSEYVEREKILELGYWHGDPTTYDNPFPKGYTAVDCIDIKSIPAADVRPVKLGKWKRENQYTLLCSKCGAYLWNNVSVNWNYCPNCGAEMRGDADV